MSLTKICVQCQTEKPFDKFVKSKESKNGYRNQCKKCYYLYFKNWRKNNPNKALAISKRYVNKHRKQINARAKEYQRKHIEKCRFYKKRYESSEIGRAKRRANNKRWAKRHPDKIRALRRRMAKKPLFRLKKTLRSRLRASLLSINTKKQFKTLDLLGCSIVFFKVYLESLFQTGMSWENYGLGHGKWVIDHIKPCCSFDLTNPEEQKRCFHYTNLRPLWHTDNQKKRLEDIKLAIK